MNNVGSVGAATDATFDDLLKERKFTFVHIWADWCSGSNMMKILVSRIAKDLNSEDITFVDVDGDTNKTVVARCNAASIPSCFMFRGGDLVGTQEGTSSQMVLSGFIDGVVNPAS